MVTPLLKKESLDADIFRNYRPVSNIAYLSKIIEKVAVKRLLDHIKLIGMDEEYQSAYKTQHSTETALLKVQHDITTALDNNLAVVFVMLDLSAAPGHVVGVDES